MGLVESDRPDTTRNPEWKTRSGDLWGLQALRINPLVQITSLCHFEFFLWYKNTDCFVPDYRDLNLPTIRSSLYIRFKGSGGQDNFGNWNVLALAGQNNVEMCSRKY